MRRSLFEPTVEGEARLLLLIDAFTSRKRGLEGRTKLAKLDFFLRYPEYLRRAVEIRSSQPAPKSPLSTGALERGMIRYRFGPWDPAYFAILGRLQGKGLVETPVGRRGCLEYRTSDLGQRIAAALAETPEWGPVADSAVLLRRHLDLTGTTLKKFVYDRFPEVADAKWGDRL